MAEGDYTRANFLRGQPIKHKGVVRIRAVSTHKLASTGMGHRSGSYSESKISVAELLSLARGTAEGMQMWQESGQAGFKKPERITAGCFIAPFCRQFQLLRPMPAEHAS